MKKGKIDYDFETISDDKFILSLEMRAGGQLIDLIFRKMKDATVKKLRLTNPAFDVKDLETVQIDMRYLKSIKVGINSTLKNIYSEVAKDGVNVLHDRVTAANFKRIRGREFWRISVKVEGLYNEKRSNNTRPAF